MKLIIISGPSGSGKSTLSKKILKKTKHGIILNTDNYYKTGLISKLFSKIIPSYFDRKISFNFKLFKKDLIFILKNGFSNFSYKYNFKRKSKKKIYKKTKNIRFVIVEGIFGKEIIKYISDQDWILIKLIAKKKTCLRRVIKRDLIERGKSKKISQKDFEKAWEVFYKNEKKEDSNNNLKTIVIRNKNDINFLNKRIITKMES